MCALYSLSLLLEGELQSGDCPLCWEPCLLCRNFSVNIGMLALWGAVRLLDVSAWMPRTYLGFVLHLHLFFSREWQWPEQRTWGVGVMLFVP